MEKKSNEFTQEQLAQRIQEGDFENELKVGFEACRLGRKVLLQYFGQLEKVEEKEQAGLVSEADRESERIIFEHLKSNFPHIEFLGEESAYLNQTQIQEAAPGKMRWILDPLDGTTNYVHRFPIFCISLALEVNGQVVMGIIDVPILNEVFFAIKGKGAFLNEKRIHVSQTEELSKSLLATGFFADDEVSLQEQLQIFAHLVRKSRGVRRPGAAAYDLAMVAKGVFDAFWEKNLKPWDSAAGQVLVQEAGGVVHSYRGKQHHPYMNSIIAGNAKMVALIEKEIQNGKFILPETD